MDGEGNSPNRELVTVGVESAYFETIIAQIELRKREPSRDDEDLAVRRFGWLLFDSSNVSAVVRLDRHDEPELVGRIDDLRVSDELVASAETARRNQRSRESR